MTQPGSTGSVLPSPDLDLNVISTDSPKCVRLMALVVKHQSEKVVGLPPQGYPSDHEPYSLHACGGRSEPSCLWQRGLYDDIWT
jgi:hypothetical protein